MINPISFFIVKGKYVFKNSGETCSKIMEGKVKNLEECRYLTKYVQSFYPNIGDIVTEETDLRYPSGCYAYTKFGTAYGMYFNHVADGSKDSNSRPLCGKFIFIILLRYNTSR